MYIAYNLQLRHSNVHVQSSHRGRSRWRGCLKAWAAGAWGASPGLAQSTSTSQQAELGTSYCR